MSYAPGVKYDPSVKYNISNIRDILGKLDSIDALTDNDYIHATTDNIRKILNKQ